MFANGWPQQQFLMHPERDDRGACTRTHCTQTRAQFSRSLVALKIQWPGSRACLFTAGSAIVESPGAHTLIVAGRRWLQNKIFWAQDRSVIARFSTIDDETSHSGIRKTDGLNHWASPRLGMLKNWRRSNVLAGPIALSRRETVALGPRDKCAFDIFPYTLDKWQCAINFSEIPSFGQVIDTLFSCNNGCSYSHMRNSGFDQSFRNKCLRINWFTNASEG